jgi:uncharacterized integral membrane protein
MQCLDVAAIATAEAAGLIIALILALILLLIYALAKVSSMLRFDTQEYTVEGKLGEVRGRLVEALRFRGLQTLVEEEAIIVDDAFKLTIRLREVGNSTRILYYAEAKTWLVLLILILLLLNAAIGAAAGFLAYLRYDDMRRSVRAALSEVGARRVR